MAIPPGRTTGPALDRLAFKIALPSALILAAACSLCVFLVSGRMPWFVPLGTLTIGTVVIYVIALAAIGRRVRTAREMLLQIRRSNFALIEESDVSKGDALGTLLRLVLKTGRSLREEIDSMHEAEDYRREYLGNVSHELKTPIFAIQGFAETLLDGALKDTKVNRKFLSKIVKHAERLTNLTNDLTEISRIESGELEMSGQDFEIRGLLAEVLEALEVEARQSEIRLQMKLPKEPLQVVADRDRIRQVLINLMDNGIKYNKPGGYVKVRANKVADGYVKISVEDNGVGIESRHMPRLTERFYRVDTSRSRNKGGTGLGLAIVKHILEAHGQKLAVESLPGEGSTLSFLLPTPTAAVTAAEESS